MIEREGKYVRLSVCLSETERESGSEREAESGKRSGSERNRNKSGEKAVIYLFFNKCTQIYSKSSKCF